MTTQQPINRAIFGKLPLDIIQYVILPFHDYKVPAAALMKEHIEVYTRIKERSSSLSDYEMTDLQFFMDPLQTQGEGDVVEATFAEWIFETQRLYNLMKLEIFM